MTAPPDPPRRRASVLHILKAYRPAFTGEGVFLERCSAVMQELAPGVQHDLLVTQTPRPASRSELTPCSTLRRVVYLNRRQAGALRRHVTLVLWMALNLPRYRTVHVRTHADWYFVSYLLARLFGRRLVLSATLDDSVPGLIRNYRPRLRRLARLGFGLFHRYVAISPKLQAENLAAGLPAESCALIPCGITAPRQAPEQVAEIRRRIGAAPDDIVLLFVGGLCARKDPLFLVRAHARLNKAHPRAKLVLVGPPLEPDHVEAIEQTIARNGLDGTVILAGEQRDPHPWFAAADIVVFASHLEGFGTVVPEGMAHAKPVVVRRLPGVNDSFVRDGETGFLFDDEEGYLSAVDRLMRDRGLARRIGRNASAYASAEFDMRAIARRYLEVYGLDDRIAPAAEGLPTTGLDCGTSIGDRRFHVPFERPPDAVPLLLTTVDAEESFDWSQPFSRSCNDVRAMAAQHRAHEVFRRHGTVPIYLVDYPVATLPDGYRPLQELFQDGLCDIGAQLHPWVNPPFLEAVTATNSFAGNLPTALEFEKARRLTEAIAERFGLQPGMYRTGRYGAGPRTGDIVKRLGYRVDSSLAVCWPPESAARGRLCWSMTARPYWIDRDRTVLELPVSAGLVGGLARHLRGPLGHLVFGSRTARLVLAGGLSRFGLLERVRLSPEGTTLEEAKRLVRSMREIGHSVFVLTYHSPSLVPGNTPYTRTADDVRRMLDWLDGFYTFFREEIGGQPSGWRDVLGLASDRTCRQDNRAPLVDDRA